MSKKADRGEWNEEKGIFERQLETGPSVAAYSGADRAGNVFFRGPGSADDLDNGHLAAGTCGNAFLGLYEEEQVLPGAGRKDGEPGRKIPYPGNDKETGISGGKDSL